MGISQIIRIVGGLFLIAVISSCGSKKSVSEKSVIETSTNSLSETETNKETVTEKETTTTTETETTPEMVFFLPCDEDSLNNVIKSLQLTIGGLKVNKTKGGYDVFIPEQKSTNSTTSIKDTSSLKESQIVSNSSKTSLISERTSETTESKTSFWLLVKVGAICLLIGFILYPVLKYFTPIPLP